ncbi:MAG: hypothetical protein OXU23_04920 [Candidatus Poribacteria bacterium]|nr:hypothetical protein [Candidatus Poribacteria bacterium]
MVLISGLILSVMTVTFAGRNNDYDGSLSGHVSTWQGKKDKLPRRMHVSMEDIKSGRMGHGALLRMCQIRKLQDLLMTLDQWRLTHGSMSPIIIEVISVAK